MNFCSKCGNPLNPNARFCGSCGASNENIQQQAASSVQYPVVDRVSPAVPDSGQEFRMPNTQRRIEYIWYVISLLFLFSVFLPGMLGIDGMDGGFGISFLAGFMVMVGLIVIVIYHGRAKQMDKIISGVGRIAVWHYTPDEWIQFVAADFEDEKRNKKNLFIMVVVISLIIGVLLMITIQDPLILLIIAVILAIVAVPAFWVPRLRFRKLKRSEAHALISETGVIVGNMFHLWIKLGANLDQVSIEAEAEPNILNFNYSMPTRTGIQEEVARVPVPKGKMGEALWIVEHFSKR